MEPESLGGAVEPESLGTSSLGGAVDPESLGTSSLGGAVDPESLGTSSVGVSGFFTFTQLNSLSDLSLYVPHSINALNSINEILFPSFGGNESPSVSPFPIVLIMFANILLRGLPVVYALALVTSVGISNNFLILLPMDVFAVNNLIKPVCLNFLLDDLY